MRERAIRDVDQLNDEELFATLAEGMDYILHNAEEYYADSEHMAARERSPSFGVLWNIAEEEAAKYFILLDAARCPRQGSRLRNHFAKFYNHLARGIYALLTQGQPPTYADLRQIVDAERQNLFLDGPDGDNYIYRNRIQERRESRMYVEFEAVDDEHIWSVPRHNDPSMAQILRGVRPPALELARAVHEVGLATSTGLAIVAEKWRPVSMVDAFSWSMLQQLNRATCEAVVSTGRAPGAATKVVDFVIRRWQYPMHELDLRPINVPQAELESRRLDSYLSEFDSDIR
jgi:AbiV family abortive infection protein